MILSGVRSVLLTTEGTYPYHRGGVSTWCEALTRRLADIEFHLLAVTMDPFVTPHYELAPNIRSLIGVPLWGTNDPAEYGPGSLRAYLQRRWGTTGEGIRERVLPHYEKFVREVVIPVAPRRALGLPLLRLHLELQHADYHLAMTHRSLWDAFDRAVRDGWRGAHPDADAPSNADVRDAWRTVYRLLLPLAADVPRVDVAHASAAAFCGLPCIMAKLRHGTPFLLTEHGVYLREQYLHLDRTAASPFARWFLARLIATIVDLNYAFADQISPVCDYNTRWERWREADASRIRVIYNGADPDRFQAAPRPANARPTVVSLGRIGPLKGQLDLIEATPRIRRDVPDVVVRLYGDVADDVYFARCASRVRELDLADHVVFAGATDAPWAMLRTADVVALPSVSEAFPFAVIEAMLTERAIVATDVGGVREALGDSGTLVTPHDVAALSTAIVALLRNPEMRERMGRVARDRARRHFTEAAFADAYRDTYARLVVTARVAAAEVQNVATA